MFLKRQTIERMAEMARESLGPDLDRKAITGLADFTIRKWERTGNDEAYLLTLWEDELGDYRTRAIINEIGRLNYEQNQHRT